MFSFEYGETFKNTCFEEHLRVMAASEVLRRSQMAWKIFDPYFFLSNIRITVRKQSPGGVL